MAPKLIFSDAQLHQLALEVATRVQRHALVLVSAESCTGGWIAKQLTDLPGSSAWFDAGVVTYSNRAKQALLGVTADTLARAGAVSEDTAREMVAGALSRFGAGIAVAVTGVAGPAGGSVAKPVGTVWLAWLRRGATAQARSFLFDGDREAVRRQAVAAALDGILTMLAD